MTQISNDASNNHVDPAIRLRLPSEFIALISLLVFITGALSLATPAHASAPADVWFVKAGAAGDGKSAESPIGSSTTIERKSGPGDTIFLLPGDVALEGGLTLKAGQSLIGLSEAGRKPAITNTDPTRNGGCGIVLANDSRVSNVRIESTHASGIYGFNTSAVRIDDVQVHGANQSGSLMEVTYPTLPGGLPHGGMVFVHSAAPALVQITSSEVTNSAAFGIISITSGTAHSRLSISHTRVEGGSKIGFFDAGISALVRGSEARVRLEVHDSEVQGRLSRSGRNVMIVASGGAKANARIERFKSGPTGQDGIVGAVMQSPSEIDIHISDSLVEGAAQMNVEGSLINLPPDNPSHANKGRVSIEIEASTIRNAGAVSGFEDIAANVWLGPSQFLEDKPPAVGSYQLQVSDSRVKGAGRSGLEFGDLPLLNQGQVDESEYEVVLRGNTIVNNGKADVMIYAPRARIDARGNCWGRPEGLSEQRIVVRSPSSLTQLDATKPVSCYEEPSRDVPD